MFHDQNGEFCLDFAPEVIEKTGCLDSYFAFRGLNPSSGPDFFKKKSSSTDLAICAFLGGTGEGGRELPLQRMVPRSDFYPWIWPYGHGQLKVNIYIGKMVIFTSFWSFGG